MCEYFKYEVKRLERTRIMHISLQGLPVGEFRALDEVELKTLAKLIENSSSEAKANSKTKKKHTGKKSSGASKAGKSSKPGQSKRPPAAKKNDRRPWKRGRR